MLDFFWDDEYRAEEGSRIGGAIGILLVIWLWVNRIKHMIAINADPHITGDNLETLMLQDMLLYVMIGSFAIPIACHWLGRWSVRAAKNGVTRWEHAKKELSRNKND